jgi:chitinase
MDFALYTDLEGSGGRVSIRSCTADLEVSSTSFGNDSCNASANMTMVTSPLQLGSDTGAATGSTSEAVVALKQLLAYESITQAPCNETLNFVYSGDTSVGVYMGSGLHRQGLLSSIINDLIEQITKDGVTENQLVQLCDTNNNARYTTGIIINSNGNLATTQQAVQAWRNGTCVTTLDSTSTWNDLTYSTPVVSQKNSNSTYNLSRRGSEMNALRRDTSGTCSTVQVVSGDTCTSLEAECGITAAELYSYNPSSTLCSDLSVGQYICCTSGSLPDYAPSPSSDGYCYSYTVQTGDSCSVLAATYTITVDDIETWNNETWGWMGCDDLLANENICLSSGYPPMPAVIANAVCGPQVNGTITAPYGTNLSTLNECPLNACCDIWGQCGITAEFCTITTSVTGNPGTAANGTNGCISNCGTEIVQSDAPSEVFRIGYFEGFDIERPCLRPLISDMDLSNYTHIHMSFATLNSDFSINISSIESQMSAFSSLSGVKRIITIGGWDFSTDAGTYDIFREAVSSADNRGTLIDNVFSFLDQWDLDGVDWDWEYPGEPDIPGIPADTTDHAEDFFLLLMEMAEQLPSGKTISTTAPSSFWYMKAIPIQAISEVVDYIVMMTYDLHGQWDWNNTNSNPDCPTGSCLRSHVNLTETISAMSMITKAGVSSNKIAMGVASYARSFQMAEAGCYGPECLFTGPASGAVPGVCTQTAGYIANTELFAIADNQSVYTYLDDNSNSYIMVWDDTQWASYMDSAIKDSRSSLYEGMNFLGIADWAIDLQGSPSDISTTTTVIVSSTTTMSTSSPTITGTATTTISDSYAYTYTNTDGYVVACPTDVVIVENGNFDVICVSGTTVGTVPVITTTVYETTTLPDVYITSTSVVVAPTPTPTICAIEAWNNNSESVSLGGSFNINYVMGWTLYRDGEAIAWPKYGNNNPCAYHPALLDSPLPYVIEWYGEGCVGAITNCMINYGDQTRLYGKAGDDRGLWNDYWWCYVEFYC